MRPRQHNIHGGVSPKKRPAVIFSLQAPGIRTDIAWAMKKRRTKSPALTAAAQLALPSSASRLPATDTLAGSSHNEESRRQSSDTEGEQPKCFDRRRKKDTGGDQLKCFYRRRKKVYTRRKFQHPRVSTAAAVADATPLLSENNCEVNYESNGQGNTITAAVVVEASEESAPSSASLNAWNESRSRRRTRELPPPSVSAGVAGTVGNEDRTNGKEPEAVAAAAAVGVGRSQRQRKPKEFKDFVDTGSARYDWMTYYPNVPFPEDNGHAMDDVEQLGEVEPITTVSEGGSSDILDNADKPFSLKLQTDIQKTRKARRILVEDSPYYPSPSRRRRLPNQTVYALPATKAAAADAATAPALPKEMSSSMCPVSPDKLQESNGECEAGNRTPASPNESATPAATTEDDKDSCWIPSDDDSLRNAGTRFDEERLTFEFKVSGPTRDSSRLLNNGFPDSMTFKAKVKLKKKRPRPKVWRPEKVKVAKPVKVPETAFERKQHRPARGAFEHDENTERAAAAAAAREHSLRASALARVVKPASGRKAQSRKRRRQNERAKSATNAADSASVPTTAEVPRISVAAEANHSSMEMVSDRCTITVDLTSSIVPTVENGGPTSEKRAFCSSALEQELPLPDPGASESDLQHRGHLDASRCTLNCGGVPFPDGSDPIDEPPSTPRGNTLAVLPASTPFLNSPSFAPNENAFGGGDSSDCESEQTWCTPTRRKRSTLTRQTRRSIFSAVESAAAAEGNDGYVAVLKPSGDAAPVDTSANQLVCLQPNSTSPFPLPLESVAQDGLFQLVVYSPKPSDMVVYQDMRPKIKYKPKVNLDPLTINTFERLMLQGGEVNDTDHADKDWVEARKLWSGRAHDFNSIMRQVQGDRAFSKWGGSVLDSMVGAFLTQNVSDFLSSNAFMALRARFPAPEDVRTATVVSSEEQSSQVEEIILDGSTEGTRADFDSGTPRMAAELVPMEASIELVDAAGIDIQQENASPMADAGIQDAEVVTEASTTHTCMTSFSFESQEETVTVVNSPARDDARGDPGQLDPLNLSADDLSAEIHESRLDINDLVSDMGAAHLGATPAALGSYSSIQRSGARAGIPDEPPPVTETNLEEPGFANRVQGNPSQVYSSANQAATEDDGAKDSHSDMAAQPGKVSSPSKSHSWLEATMEKDTSTPDETEKVLADALRRILGKEKTEREDRSEDQRVPLKLLKLKKPRNNRSVDINRFKTNIKLLSGGERANYELKVHYKLNSEQKVTWEAVRDDVLSNKEIGRNIFTADSVDWEAVRRADVAELANVIKERGMNNVLGGRIKSLLDRIHRDQDGSLDLEWVRKLSPVNAQNFLTSVRGLGIKSVECIRLLTLHHPSFPVDTNVGRIVVRLGWVPLEPLPEETQLHLLEMYPVQEQIQKYIWPRLCTLDQQTLYEFHYQLITFGKVFCTKSKPNCNACPMQSKCKHYESAYCSARKLLMGPEEPPSNSENQIAPLMSRPSMQTPLEECRNVLMLEGNARAPGGVCVPIIEEPNSPEDVPDIEDISYNVNCNDVDTDYVELPPANCEIKPSANNTGSVYVELNEASSQNVIEVCRKEIQIRSAGQENEGCIEDDVDESIPQVLGEEDAHLPSQELVLLPPGAASFPAPSLKNVQRLRTIHYVYELPEHHPLLAKMDKRDLEDPCYYLLAIWSADEVPEAMPKISDDDASNPFACCQSGDESVWGTLLVPCRTAMKGSFPLNGTYFQVNEVFADHESSIAPIDVPRTLLWNLNRKFVYFGTSVTSIFKDMSQEEIQCCFKKGYICVRAFDQATRQPKLLASRLHQSGARIVAARAVGPKGRRASKSKVVL